MKPPIDVLLTVVSLAVPILMVFTTATTWAQRPGTHTDESKVPQYTLPKILTGNDGRTISTTAEWENVRRPEVHQLFADHVYGNVPTADVPVSFEVGKSWDALGGTAIRKEIRMTIGPADQGVVATLLLTLPKSTNPVPCFLGFNFHGNHTTTKDPHVGITTSWVRNSAASHSADHRANAEGRGSSSSRWPYEEIIQAGYGVGTVYYGDIDPDNDDGFQNGIHPLFYTDDQTHPTKHQWGSIGAWSWSLSRLLDYLETDSDVNEKRVAVIGHSRLGKTALWAGATDTRFAIVISNDSGCGGAALSRRGFGETVAVINNSFPHWFCDQFVEYNGNENRLPVDQHMLIALIAPRSVYVASATGDPWADPRGEFLSLANADSVYQLYEKKTMPREWPSPDSPLRAGSRGYHLRTGKHNITLYDWQQYLRFADQQFGLGSNRAGSLRENPDPENSPGAVLGNVLGNE